MSPQWSWPATPSFSPAASAANAGRSDAKPVNDSNRSHSFQNCQIVSRVRGSANTRVELRGEAGVGGQRSVRGRGSSASSGIVCQNVYESRDAIS